MWRLVGIGTAIGAIATPVIGMVSLMIHDPDITPETMTGTEYLWGLSVIFVMPWVGAAVGAVIGGLVFWLRKLARLRSATSR